MLDWLSHPGAPIFHLFYGHLLCVCVRVCMYVHVGVSLLLPCVSFIFHLGFLFLGSTSSSQGLPLPSCVSVVYSPFLTQNAHATVKSLSDINKPELVLQQATCLLSLGTKSPKCSLGTRLNQAAKSKRLYSPQSSLLLVISLRARWRHKHKKIA